MRTQRTLLGAVGAAVLSAASLGAPGKATAAELRLAPSTFCQPEHSVMDIFANVTVDRVRRVGPQLRSTWGPNTVICGFPSGDSLLHQNVAQVKIRGHRGNIGDFTEGGVQACVGTFGGGELCGYSTDFGDGGNFTVLVNDLSRWGNTYFYPYLKIRMQTGDRLYGIVATD